MKVGLETINTSIDFLLKHSVLFSECGALVFGGLSVQDGWRLGLCFLLFVELSLLRSKWGSTTATTEVFTPSDLGFFQ